MPLDRRRWPAWPIACLGLASFGLPTTPEVVLGYQMFLAAMDFGFKHRNPTAILGWSANFVAAAGLVALARGRFVGAYRFGFVATGLALPSLLLFGPAIDQTVRQHGLPGLVWLAGYFAWLATFPALALAGWSSSDRPRSAGRRPQTGIGRLMIVIALVALLLGGWRVVHAFLTYRTPIVFW